MTDGYLRIGEFSERVGVNPDLLRAWERRYGLLRPDRSAGGFRLYSDDDVARVRQVLRLADQGLSTAEAARMALREPDGAGPPAAATSPVATPAEPLTEAAERFAQALFRYEEDTAHGTLDELLTVYSVETVLGEVVLPQLARIGERWATGELSVAQEHFASNLVRGRLLAMARGWGLGAGPMAVLAAPPGEGHDLPLVVFGIALWRRGWRITFLGADTPIDSLRDAIDVLTPQLLVLATVDGVRLEGVEDELAELGRRVQLAIAGAGSSAELAARIGAGHITGDPVSAAQMVAANPAAARGPEA